MKIFDTIWGICEWLYTDDNFIYFHAIREWLYTDDNFIYFHPIRVDDSSEIGNENSVHDISYGVKFSYFTITVSAFPTNQEPAARPWNDGKNLWRHLSFLPNFQWFIVIVKSTRSAYFIKHIQNSNDLLLVFTVTLMFSKFTINLPCGLIIFSDQKSFIRSESLFFSVCP